MNSTIKIVLYIIGGIILILFLYSSRSSRIDTRENDSGYLGRFDERQIEENPPITSDNWNCTSDCSGHNAGYEWASDHGISDPSDCDGKSESFIEGCEAYANEQMMENQEENQYDYDY